MITTDMAPEIANAFLADYVFLAANALCGSVGSPGVARKYEIASPKNAGVNTGVVIEPPFASIAAEIFSRPPACETPKIDPRIKMNPTIIKY